MTSRQRLLNVFVNVPFDDAYEPLFEALVFTTFACGYRVRCALEDSDNGDIRLDKLVELIRESPRSIHDLSRIEPGENELPRFNMPFELGLALGAKRFGRRPLDRIKIMVAEPYRLPAYLSDLGGNDPDAHKNEPRESFASSATGCSVRPKEACWQDRRSSRQPRGLGPGCRRSQRTSISNLKRCTAMATIQRSPGA